MPRDTQIQIILSVRLILKDVFIFHCSELFCFRFFWALQMWKVNAESLRVEEKEVFSYKLN